ncbi:pitrilysin family protein [Geobacter sp. SVR]|uniref:M16 family metallopeptidase n=1 Tax=Geobacter sp. SVR TaxID=2495594 RepID=UPI00143EFDC7|nr:pitrilysin family protein [Geobacter sp. SVR]BCS52356.1 peptidase M16 [Geobacter sp. SVR]GCF84985.1 peptidase M16 [Geobacter sp. SVR]
MIRPFVHTLANGLRVVCVEMPHLHAAELAVYLKVGGRNDPPGKEGLSHFLEHTLFRGTRHFGSSLEIESAFEAIGGAPNAATDAESTCYYSRIHPAHVRRGMEIFASMLLHPLLEGIDIEKRIIAEEAREDLNERGQEINPDTISSRLLWPRHPLGKPTIGTLKSIAGMCRADLEAHLRKYYVPTAAVLVVAGPVRSHEVFAAAMETFGQWQGAAMPAAMPVTRWHDEPQVRFVRDSDSQMSLQLAFLGISRGDERFMAQRLLRRLLAGGGSSRLHLRLREQLGIVYSVEGAIGAYDETGCLSIDLSTAPETLVQAVEVTLDETARLVEQPVPETELERICQSYIFDLEYSRDSAYEMGGRYGWGELMQVVRSIEEDQQEARAVTAADLRELAKTLFMPANLRLVAVGPWNRTIKARTVELVERYASRLKAAGTPQ